MGNDTIPGSGGMRTKRRYAHDLYPHPEEGEVRPLAVEVPYLYAQAVGWETAGSGWFENRNDEKYRAQVLLRIDMKLAAQERAFLADALHQGMVGQEAWNWAQENLSEPDICAETVWTRAVHFGVDPLKIKPFPCGPEPDHHDHLGEPEDRLHGGRLVTRIEGRGSDCPDCCELVVSDSTTIERS